jgi:hypothetical protein
MDVGGEKLIPRITRRCLTDDLGLPADSVDVPIDEHASSNDVIAAFRDRRAEMGSPGQEPIRSLLPEVVAFSLHVGRRRGATWHHREAGVIWLLAVGYHREGHVDDAYAYFARLKAAGRLLPDATTCSRSSARRLRRLPAACCTTFLGSWPPRVGTQGWSSRG